MRHRHRGVLVQQQFRNGQPHDITAPDHHGTLAGDLHARGLQHLDDPLRRAGQRAGLLLPQRRHIERMETVHVLRLVDGGDHLLLVDMLRQRQLHQNPVHLRIGVQSGDDSEQLLLGDRLGLADRRVANAHLGRSLGLARHITHAGGVLAHENHHQMRHTPVFRGKVLHLLRHLGLQPGRQLFSADYHIRIIIITDSICRKI